MPLAIYDLFRPHFISISVISSCIMASIPQLFGIIPTSCAVLTTPTSAPSPTSFTYTLPARPFSHIVAFLLPGVSLPPDTAAAVYLALPNTTTNNHGGMPEFRFLGGIGPGKESAIFSIKGLRWASNGGEVDMDADLASRELVLGISIESAASVSAQMAALPSQQAPTSNPSSALVVASRPSATPASASTTVALAQKIIKNAFNFLASFSGNVPVPGSSGTAGVEVVPLKAFQDWWTKFEGRIRNDPGFLERDGD